MLEFERFLKEYLGQIDPDIVRIIKTRNELLQTLSSKIGIDESIVSKEYQLFVKRLKGDFFFDGWHINFTKEPVEKILNNTIVFERFLGADKIMRIVEVNNRFIKKKLVSSLQKLDWKDFEMFCYHIFDSEYFPAFKSIVQTNPGADGGIDLKGVIEYEPEKLKGGIEIPGAKPKRVPFEAQIKKEKKKIGRPVLAQLIGDMDPKQKGKGIVISASGFAKDAIRYAQKREMILISLEADGNSVWGLADIMLEKQKDIYDNDEEVKLFRDNNYLMELGLDY